MSAHKKTRLQEPGFKVVLRVTLVKLGVYLRNRIINQLIA